MSNATNFHKQLNAKRLRLPLLLFILTILLNAAGLYHGSYFSHIPLSSFAGQHQQQVQVHLTVKAVGTNNNSSSNSSSLQQQANSTVLQQAGRKDGGAAGASAAAAAPEAPKFDMRLQFNTWLSFAEADAARHGLQIPQDCNSSQGLQFLQRFKQSHGVLCGGPNNNNNKPSSSSSSSSVECCAYPVEQKGLACWAKNLVLNATAFMGQDVPKGEQEHSKYVPIGPAGSVQLGCHMMQQSDAASLLPAGSLKSVWQSGAGANLQGEGVPWFKTAAVEKEAAVIQRYCNSGSGANVVRHPVMFVTRLDTTNPYHHTQSIIQAFLTLAIMDDSSKLPGLQVIIADHFDPGPFIDIWQRVSDPYPVLSLSSPVFTTAPAAAAAGGMTCFQQSIHAHYVGPGRAFLGYEGIGQERTCASTVIMAAAHWQRYLFREQLPAPERREYERLAKTAEAAAKTAAAGAKTAARTAAVAAAKAAAEAAAEAAKAAAAAADLLAADGLNQSAATMRATAAAAAAAAAASSSKSSTSSGPLASNTTSKPVPQQQQQQQQKAPSEKEEEGLQAPNLHRRLNVVWLSRSWFSKSMQAGGGLTGWQSSRALPANQESDIVKALESAVLDWNNNACAPPVFGWWQKAHPVPPQTGCKATNVSFDFRFAELSVEDLNPDQISLLTRTAVLVGVHGAALTNQIWMRPHRGAVVEFGASGNFHYVNMAYELGHKHFRVDGVSPQTLAAAVKNAMDHVSSRY